MFDIGSILKRAWNTLWHYRVLWIFALLLAMSGGAGGGGGGGGGGSSGAANLPAAGGPIVEEGGGLIHGDSPLSEWAGELESWAEVNLFPLFATEEMAIRTAIAIAAIILGIGLLLNLLFALVRYPTETAVIRMVDAHEETGEKLTFKQGWKLGWNARALRVFLVDLLIGLSAFFLIMIPSGLLVWIIFGLVSIDTMPVASIIGILIIVLMFIVFLLALFFVGFIRQHVVRYAVLDDLGVGESFSRGWGLFRSRFKDTFLMGVVLIGVGLGFGFALMIAAFLLIPVYVLMVVPGALVAGLPGGLAYLLASLSVPSAVAAVIALVVALPFFFTVVFLPLLFLNGMFAVFTSNAWTLTFRQLKPGAPPPLPLIE